MNDTLTPKIKEICLQVEGQVRNSKKYLFHIVKTGQETKQFKTRLTLLKKKQVKLYLDNLVPNQDNNEIIKFYARGGIFKTK